MQQKHNMILWANPNNDDTHTTIGKAYQLLKTLEEFGPELSPKYLPAYRKKNVKIFLLNCESLGELIKKRINKEGNSTFPDLGYHISFFSSLNDIDSAGIDLHIGVTNYKFTNTMVVSFPISLNIGNNSISEKIVTLFKTSVKIFEPFWGCISNSLNSRRFNTLYHDNLPTTVHWMNFWGLDIVNKVTKDRLFEAPLYSLEQIGDKGYLLKIKKEPINDNSEDDVRLQAEVNMKLGLSNQ